MGLKNTNAGLYTISLSLKQAWITKALITSLYQIILHLFLKKPFDIPNPWSLLWDAVQLWLGAAVGGYFLFSLRAVCA